MRRRRMGEANEEEDGGRRRRRRRRRSAELLNWQLPIWKQKQLPSKNLASLTSISPFTSPFNISLPPHPSISLSFLTLQHLSSPSPFNISLLPHPSISLSSLTLQYLSPSSPFNIFLPPFYTFSPPTPHHFFSFCFPSISFHSSSPPLLFLILFSPLPYFLPSPSLPPTPLSLPLLLLPPPLTPHSLLVSPPSDCMVTRCCNLLLSSCD